MSSNDDDIEAPLTLPLSTKMICLENRKDRTKRLQQVFGIDFSDRIYFTSLGSSNSSFDSSSSGESPNREVEDLIEARFGEGSSR